MSFGSGYARAFAGIDDDLPPSDHDPLVHERIMPPGLGDTPSSAGSAPDMLHRFGINASQAVLAVATLMGTTVGNATPAAAGTQIVVKGAQQALNEIAAGAGSKERLQVDGILGAQTLKALNFQMSTVNSSNTLMNTPWITVYSVLRNKIDGKQFKWTTLKNTVPAVNQPTNTVNEVEPEGGGLFTVQNAAIVGGGALLAALLFGGKKGGGSRRKGRR
jgi:hypothetical protein